VAAHHLELRHLQRPALGEQRDGDRELADVVQLGRAGDLLARAAIEAERDRHAGGELRHLAGVVQQRRFLDGQPLQQDVGGHPASARRGSHPSDRHDAREIRAPGRHTL